MSKPATPELDKMSAVREQSQACAANCSTGSAASAACALMRWETWTENDSCPRCSGATARYQASCVRCGGTGQVEVTREGFQPYKQPIPHILAEFFGIDLDAVDREQRALLEFVRGEH